ncbi:hypothetical protein HK405_011651, partial [Cladochytrium tenue]
MESSAAADAASGFRQRVVQLQRRFQTLLDQTTPYYTYRWAATAGLLLLYFVRVWLLAAFYIVTYALGIYLLNLFLAFLQPKFDPAMELEAAEGDDAEGPALPVNADDEFRPFIRRLPEFKF